MSLLSDSESSADERKPNERLKINEKFADRFQRSERVKDLHRAKELLKNAELDEDEESDSESETEDEDAEQLSTGLDLKIIQTINSLRKKDPKIYDSNTVWFDKKEDSDSSDDDEASVQKASKKKKFKDILREQLLESGSSGGLGDGDGIETSARGVRDTASRNTLVYDAEQEKIRQAFIKSAGGLEAKKSKAKSAKEDSDSDNEDEILQVKSKSAQELKAEEIELQKALQEMRQLSEKNAQTDKGNVKSSKAKTAVLEIDEGDGFLETYLEKQMWKEKSNALKHRVAQQSDDEDLEGDEEELEQMEKFESKYNFRFEELQDQKARFGEEGEPALEVVGHARDVQGSMRRVDEKRKTQRESRKERKEKERRQQEAELRRLKNLKRQELRERLKQISKMSGLEDLLDDEDEDDETDGGMELDNIDEQETSSKKKKSRRGGKRAAGKGKVQLSEEFLDEDWDPEKHEALMAAQFGEDYYDQEDNDFNVADMDDPTAYEQYLGDDGLGEIDYEDEDDGVVYDGGKSNGNGSGNAAARAELRKTAAEMEEELYQLDYEDIVAGLPCRFKYKSVEKEGFGLSAEDILLADDSELNKYVSLKKISAYSHHSGVNDTDLSKKRKRLRENVKERLARLAEEAEQAGQQVKGTKPKSKVDEGEGDEEGADDGVEDIEAGDENKKRKRKRRKGTNPSAAAPQLITKASVAAETVASSNSKDVRASKDVNEEYSKEKSKEKSKDKSKDKSKKSKKSQKEESAQDKRMNLYR